MKKKPKKIAMKAFVKRIRKAIDNNKLGCQTSKELCLYDYGRGIHCIIGAGLSDAMIKKIKSKKLNSDNGIITISQKLNFNFGEYEQKLFNLQKQHDNLCQGIKLTNLNYSDKKHYEIMLKDFAKLEKEVLAS